MESSYPTLIGIIGTIIALGFFANGWRMRSRGRAGSALGCAHMIMALLFIPMIWWIILRLLPG